MVSLVRRSRPLQVLEGSQLPSLISSCFVVVICHRVVLRCVSGLGDMGASHAGNWRPRLRGRTLDPPAASVSEEVGRDYAGGNEAVSESRRAESDSLIVGSHTGSRDLLNQIQRPLLRVWPRVRVLAHQLSPKHRVLRHPPDQLRPMFRIATALLAITSTTLPSPTSWFMKPSKAAPQRAAPKTPAGHLPRRVAVRDCFLARHQDPAHLTNSKISHDVEPWSAWYPRWRSCKSILLLVPPGGSQLG